MTKNLSDFENREQGHGTRHGSIWDSFDKEVQTKRARPSPDADLVTIEVARYLKVFVDYHFFAI